MLKILLLLLLVSFTFGYEYNLLPHDICEQTKDLLPHYISLEFERYTEAVEIARLIYLNSGLYLALIIWCIAIPIVNRLLFPPYFVVVFGLSLLTWGVVSQLSHINFVEPTFENFMQIKNKIYIDRIEIGDFAIEGIFRYDGVKNFIDGFVEVTKNDHLMYKSFIHCG